MKDIWRYLIFLLVIMVLCVLYTFRSSILPQSAQEKIETIWVDEWLKNPTCQPPCLDNITPGATHKDEIASNLMRHPGIDRVEQYPGSVFEDRFYWYILECKDNYIGVVKIDKDKNLVKYIYLEGPSCGAKLQLGDIISAFGEPEYVYAYRLRGWGRACGVDLFYIDKGLRLSYSMPIGFFKNRLEIATDSNIDHVLLFEPQDSLEQTITYQSQINSQIFPEKDQIVPWDGYKKYECLGSESY